MILYWTIKRLNEIKSCKDDLNKMALFNEKDRKILNPIYDEELDVLRSKKLPVGIITRKGKIF